MNTNNKQFLSMLNQHSKDFCEFILENNHHHMIHTLYEMIKNMIDIDNLCCLYMNNHHKNDDYYSIYKTDIDHNFSFEHISESLYVKYHVYSVPIQSESMNYGYFFFCRDKNKEIYSDEDKDFLNHIGNIYNHIFLVKNIYQIKKMDHSITGQILESINANVYITNPYTDEILYMNNKMKEAYQLEQPIGQKCWKAFYQNQKGRCLQCPVNHLIQNPKQCVTWEEHNSYNQRIYRNYDSMIQWYDQSLVHFQYSIDVTQLKEAQNDARYDELTGIYNRRAGQAELSLQVEKAKKENKNIVVCLYDLDHLKTINDTYGHQLGDSFIQMITKTVQSYLNPQDLFFRLSGDEFVISFYNHTTHQANQTMLLILDKLKTKQTNENIPYVLSFCFGLYEVLPHYQLSLTDMITHADEKMYTWKKRNHLRQAIHDLKTHSPIVEQFDYNKDLLYDALVKSTDDYIFICNMKTGVFKYTPEMVDEFAFPSEVLTNAAAVFGSKIHKDDKYEFLNSNQQITDGRTDSHIVEYRALNKNNEYVWLRCRGHVEYDENDEPCLFAGFISNLGRKNYRDNLTGLYNHFEFEKQMNELSAPFAIMILNINHFKVINQLYNHEFGNHVLRIIAQNIQTLFYKKATLFKLDGDEFGLILKETDEESLNHIFHKIQSFANQKHVYEDKPFTCHFKAGVAIKSHNNMTYLELRRNCEIALQHSKRSPNKDLTFFNPDLFNEETYTLRLQSTLKQSITNQFEGFSLVFQPKVKAHSHSLMGFEALIRWNHPQFPQIGPGAFIPVLEETGGIIQLGHWIFEQSLIQFQSFLEYAPDIMISINISYIQLIEENFILFVKTMLTRYQIPAHQVILELTETTIVKDNQKVNEIINELRLLGLKIAMDDFGKGYSSLSLLKDEPLDIIKIDQSFVRNIKNDSFNYSFTKFMIGLCHELQLKVVVEGVETKEELDIIESFQPDYIQGYYISYPLCLDDALSYTQK